MQLLDRTARFEATLIVGFNELRGGALYNTALVAHKGHLLGAYSKWVRGDRTPSGDWLIKMLQLCPDEDTRAAFGVAPSTISVADVAVGDDEVQAYYHHAETGLKLLAESASQGHRGAKEELRHLAELIARRAAKWQHGKK